MAAASSAPSVRVRAAVLAAFAGDSLSLGPHWEYQTDRIAAEFKGPVTDLAAPIATYHPGKTAGDQTHIGDNALLLLRNLAAAPDAGFHLDSYLQSWQAVWDVPTPPAYLDHATKDVLAGLKAGKTGAERASTDDDLSHSAKFFPLLAAYAADEEALVAATRSLVSTFQRGENQIITGEWLARSVFRVLHQGVKPSVALEAVAAQLNNAWLSEHVAKGKASAQQKGLSDVEALRSYGDKKECPGDKHIYFGYSCGTAYGVPAVVHHILRTEDAADWSEALVDTVSVGGNSNARAIALATLLGAYRGIEPKSRVEKWSQQIKAKDEVNSLLDTIEQKKKQGSK